MGEISMTADAGRLSCIKADKISFGQKLFQYSTSRIAYRRSPHLIFGVKVPQDEGIFNVECCDKTVCLHLNAWRNIQRDDIDWGPQVRYVGLNNSVLFGFVLEWTVYVLNWIADEYSSASSWLAWSGVKDTCITCDPNGIIVLQPRFLNAYVWRLVAYCS